MVGLDRLRCLVGLVGLALTACAHNVAQDAATGADGKEKGAKPVTLDNGEGHASGIVTYPGGDRVDWKMVEIPEKKRGELEVKLAWAPPRPGLQLAFDVFDEWNQPIVQSKKTAKKRSAGRIRTATVEDAKGKYFIRVYAVGRGDAGKYKLNLEFKETPNAAGVDYAKLDIPDPPKLASVPDAPIVCDEFAFDIKNPDCKNVCPKTGAPPGWPACKDICPTPPDINVPACLAIMECPNPPDRRVRKCTAPHFAKCLDPKNPDPANPNCDNIKIPPVIARIIGNNVQGSDVIITIGAGTNSGVGKNWNATVLRGDGEQPLAGGEIQVIRVDKSVTVGKVHLTTDQLSSNSKVRLSSP
ncbi:MAG TPA: hypothetical protein VH165_26920 [Kofleriaceae bacterium]|nr:hypothetical protein [Kofleriaceae bacterium]